MTLMQKSTEMINVAGEKHSFLDALSYGEFSGLLRMLFSPLNTAS